MKQPITFHIDPNQRRQTGEAEGKYRRCAAKFNADARGLYPILELNRICVSVPASSSRVTSRRYRARNYYYAEFNTRQYGCGNGGIDYYANNMSTAPAELKQFRAQKCDN